MVRAWRNPKALAGAAVFLLALLFLYWIAGDILRTAGDEGIYLEGGRRVALGQQPYRDFFALTGPLTFWIEGVLAHVSGMSLAAMRLPLILDAAFLTWAVYWFTSRYAGVAYSAGAAFAFLAYQSRERILYVNHRWDSAALATAAIAVALQAERSGRRGFWMVSGFLAAAAAWATPSLLIAALPLLFWSCRRGARGFLALAAGGTLATAIAVVCLQGHHALLPMIQSMRWTSANYVRANRVPYGSVWAGADPAAFHIEGSSYILTTLWIAAAAVLPPVAIAGWAWFWRAGRNRTEFQEILPLLAAVGALVLAAWPRWTSDALVHTLALPWFLCALLLHRLDAPRLRFWCCGVVLLVSAASLSAKAIAPLNYWPRETRVGSLRDPDNEVDLLEGLEHWIQPGDSLFSFPYMPSAYYFLNARNPTRYSFLQPGMMTGTDEQRALAELAAAPPRWVIYENYPPKAVLAIWPNSDPALIPQTAFKRYFQEHYRPVDTVAGPWAHVVVMERLPVTPTP